jgi:ABC-type sulfate transport system permease component
LWKHEIVGGVAFILAGLAYIIQVMSTVITTGFQWYYITWAIQISGIAFAIGILFLMNWHKKR